jgi:hypothetical protein
VHGGVVLGHRLGPTRAAFVLDAGTRPQFALLVANAVADAVNTGTLGGSDALDSTSVGYIAPGVSAAWAPHRSLGLIGEARLIWTRRVTTDDSQTQSGVILSGSADWDLDPVIGFPVAFQGVARVETRYQSPGINRVLDLGGGIYYTRRVNLQLGLQVLRRSGELRREPIPSLDLAMAVATVSLRYYW